MPTTIAETTDLDEIRNDNVRAVNTLRLLYLSLNDVVAFEHAVLADGNIYRVRPQPSES